MNLNPDVQEWRNLNRYRRYPFVDDAIVVDGGFTLPDDVIVDFVFSCEADIVSVGLASINVDHDAGITFTFTITLNDATTLSLAVLAPASGTGYYSGSSSGDYSEGRSYTAEIVFNLTAFTVFDTETTYNFDIALAVIVPGLWQGLGATRVKTLNGKTGTVLFEDGYNIRVLLLPELNTIRFLAGVGEGLGRKCLTTPAQSDCSEVLYAIAGQTPGWFGDLLLTGAGGIVVEAGVAKLSISSTVNINRPLCQDPA